MKPPLLFAIPALLCAVACGGGRDAVADTRSIVVTANDGRPFDGWGVSLAWDAYVIKDKPPAVKAQFLDALFSAQGIGFNKIRYVIGGGQNPDLLPAGRAKCAECWIEGWEPAAGRWDDQADQPQRWMLREAIQRVQARGLRPTLEAASLAPPYWMTLSGSSAGPTTSSQPNVTDAQLRDYASYQVDVLTRLKRQDGVVFDTLSPMNEPNSAAWVATGQQEGLYLDHRQQAELINLTWSDLKASGQPTQVAANEEMRIGDFRPNQSQLSALGTFQDILTQPGGGATLAKLGQINVHTYWGDGRAELRALARRLGKNIVMSEGGCCGGWTGSYSTSFDMNGALTLADHIRQDIGILGVSSWSLWQAKWGVFQVTQDGAIQKHPQYFLLSLLTRALPANSKLLETGNEDCLISVQSQNGVRRIGVVVFNTGSSEGDHVYRIKLAAFPGARLISADQIRSNADAPGRRVETTDGVANIEAGGFIDVTAPQRSVTSVILQAP